MPAARYCLQRSLHFFYCGETSLQGPCAWASPAGATAPPSPFTAVGGVSPSSRLLDAWASLGFTFGLSGALLNRSQQMRFNTKAVLVSLPCKLGRAHGEWQQQACRALGWLVPGSAGDQRRPPGSTLPAFNLKGLPGLPLPLEGHKFFSSIFSQPQKKSVFLTPA